MKSETGPFVQTACLCDMVIRDDSGSLSLIRIVDAITHTQAGPTPPKSLPPFQHLLKLVIMLKSGTAIGRHELKIIPELPTAELKDAMTFTVHLEGEDKGHNVIVNLGFQFEHEGLHWFKVYFDDEILTSIPVRVVYNRVITPAPPQP